MAGLPDGIVTFLFTDIEGSTRLWERQPEAMRVALARHDAILRDAIESHRGQIFRTAGDAFCAVFRDALDAVAAAAMAQRALSAEVWALDAPLCVRVVLHTGEVELHAGDYVGASLNLVGRLLSVCYGGQTLVSQATQQLVDSSLPEGMSVLDLGQHRFRDLIRSEHVFQLHIDGLPDSFPPLKSVDSFPNNLPVQLTQFIGRERELAEVERLLAGTHLLTLTGPGGTGKTRLALRAAAGLLETFPDGVWLVELAPLADPALVLQSIAAVLGLREQPGRPLMEVVTDHLKSREVLLLLDNCEHLIETCAEVAETLLRACPKLKILVSSREALGIAGEVTIRVPSLSLPDLHPLPALDKMAQFEAVRLFMDRVAAVQPGFTLTSQNAHSVAQICHRLDGIPLAIELAAARVKLLPIDGIAARLDDRFRLLTGGSRTALPRQQTLEALIDWSYDLLSVTERILFRRLSVFAGGWTLEAAEVVCKDEGRRMKDDDGDGQVWIHPDEILDLLSQLVNKSLVTVDEKGLGTRYRLLETIRQYGRNKLLGSGEAVEVRGRHLTFFTELAGRAGEKLKSAERTQWAKWLEAETDNLRVAQEWALEKDLDSALRIASSLFFYWGRTGFATEARRFVAEAVKRANASPQFQQDPSRERKALLSGAYTAEGVLCINLGDNTAAYFVLQTAVRLARESGDRIALANALQMLGLAAGFVDDGELSQESGEESIALARQLGDKWLLAMSLVTLTNFGFRPQDDPRQPGESLEEGIRLFRELGDPWGDALAQMVKGMTALHTGGYAEARRWFRESHSLFESLGDQFFANITRSGLADVARALGEYEQAVAGYQESIRIWRGLGNRGAIARCLECLAFILRQQAQAGLEPEAQTSIRRAAVLLGAAESIRESFVAPMRPDEMAEYKQQFTAIQTQAGEGVFAEAWAEGRAMDLDQAVACALS